MTADDIIQTLALTPHPEGGFYRQTYATASDDRPCATCIYFLLKADQTSHWHAVDADEMWLFHAGAPLELSLAPSTEGPASAHILAAELDQGRPQILVPAHHWQSARSLGDWTLVSCVVAPGFQFSGFQLAEPGFEIPRT